MKHWASSRVSPATAPPSALSHSVGLSICSSSVQVRLEGFRRWGENRWENGTESAEWITANALGPHGHKGSAGMKKSGQCF